jgi:hypothetical protein
VNVTSVLAQVLQLQAQATVIGTAAGSSGSDFSALLQAARTAGTSGQQLALPSMLAPGAATDAETPLLAALMPANLRAATAAEPAAPAATAGASPAAPQSCLCKSH